LVPAAQGDLALFLRRPQVEALKIVSSQGKLLKNAKTSSGNHFDCIDREG
jgi:hypothetical protein